MFTLLVLLATGGEISLGSFDSLAHCHEVRSEFINIVEFEYQDNFADLICHSPLFGGY